MGSFVRIVLNNIFILLNWLHQLQETISKDSTIYEWQSMLRVSPEATVYVTANKSEKLFTDFIGAREKADISSNVHYTNGEWHLVNDDGSNSYKKPL